MPEIEAKFLVHDLTRLERRLKESGARCLQPRAHEFNLRFDNPAGDLSRAFKALRLRQDTAARLTFKGPSAVFEGASLRQEIEFKVDDFSAARRFLEALGYQIIVIYEKYRTIYSLPSPEPIGPVAEIAAHAPSPGGPMIALDELPFGNFVEIEGPTGYTIQAAADSLGVDWEARIMKSYLELFMILRKRMDLKFRDLTFENFRGMDIPPEAMGVEPAGG